MSSRVQKASKLPTAKRLSDSDHSYTKSGRQSQRGKQKPLANDSSSDDESIIEESAPCHGCKKSVAKNGVCCNFCEHWFCLTCSKLKKVVYQALKESPESLMWFCISCLTTFPGVKKMMIKVNNLEEKYDKLDERITKIEKQPNNVENIEEIVRQEVREVRDIEARRLQLVCFNLPESLSLDSETRLMDDEQSLKTTINNDMRLNDKNIEVDNLIRLGRRPEGNDTHSKHRPLRFKVRQFESKREILQANSVLKNHDEEEKKKIFMTPDLTQKQREQSFRLREELRYRKNVLGHTNLKISKGRIVSSVHGKDSTWPTEDGYDGRTFDREYRNRTFVNRNIVGGGGRASQTEPPFLRN